MREIKFRDYDKESKKMYQITDINFSDYVANGVCYGDWKDFSINNLLQYTGLKDKNGVEIYEGDIVNIYMPKVSCHTKESIVKKIVSFKKGSFILEWIDKNKKGFWATFISLSTDCDIEIIGNIYENQDLLNVI